MNYLRSFVIGSSFLVYFHFLLNVQLNPEVYGFSYQTYSFVVPLYFGTLNTFSLYLGRQLGLPLDLRLLLTAVLSIMIIFTVSYFYSRPRFSPYKNYTTRDWITYLLRNGARHIASFSIIYFLEKFLS